MKLYAEEWVNIPVDLYINPKVKYIAASSYFGRDLAVLDLVSGYELTFEGKITYKGKGSQKRIDWNRSTFTAFSDNRIGLHATEMSLSGKTAYKLNRRDPSGNGLAEYMLRGNDIITGSPDDDDLKGYAGNDILNTRGGYDTLTGGAGADVFHLNDVWSGNHYALTDFNPAEGDRIDYATNDVGFTDRLGYLKVEVLETGGARVTVPHDRYEAELGNHSFSFTIPQNSFDPAWISITTPMVVANPNGWPPSDW